jgi:hypothetical protein
MHAAAAAANSFCAVTRVLCCSLSNIASTADHYHEFYIHEYLAANWRSACSRIFRKTGSCLPLTICRTESQSHHGNTQDLQQSKADA